VTKQLALLKGCTARNKLPVTEFNKLKSINKYK
jgi:hypothetical protein